MKKALIFLILTGIITLYACRHIPPASDQSVVGANNTGSSFCFAMDILPIFQAKCATSGCHDISTQAKGYLLDSYDHILNKDIRPYDATDSKIYQSLFADPTDVHHHMPTPGRPQLSETEKSIIGRWINQGAQNTTNCGAFATCDSTQYTYMANIKPIINICITCHRPPSPPDGWDLTTYEGVKLIALNGLLVKVVTHDPGVDSMPKNLPKLSNCNIAQIKKWVAAGAPNN